MTPQVRIAVGVLILILVYSILLNIPINYHPMNPLPSIASSNVTDLLSKPLPTITHHRYTQLVIGDSPTPTTPTTSVVTATDATAPTVDPTVVAPATTTISDSVPTAPTLPIVLDTGASFLLTPFKSDFISGPPFGLIQSAASVVSKVASKAYSTPVDPYTLITGEDTTTIDLSSLDLFDLDSEFASAFEVLEFREFGTATLIFISNPHSELQSILVEPTLDWTDTWFDWIPLPRLILSESYFHIFGFDYSQAFALFHLIPIWIALVLALLRSE